MYLCSVKHHRKTYLGLFLLLALLTACGGKRMRQRLQFVAKMNSADMVFTKEWQPTVDSLADYFSSHGTENERMTAYYLQGRVHHDLGEAPQALDAYQRATEQADTTRDDCDLRTLTAIYGQMADLFHAQYLPDNEMKALQTAERIAWKNGDTLDALVAFDLRSRPYYLRNEKDSVLFVEKQARKRYLKYGYKERAAQAMFGSISILLDREQYDEANRYFQIFEQESDWFDSEGNIMEGKEACYYEKGRYLLAVGKVDSALFYFYKAIVGHKEAGYQGLLSVYEKKNIPDSIAKYAKLYVSANDSNYLHVNQEKVHQISAMYDYSRHQQMAKEKAKEVSKLWNIILAILFICLLAVGSFYFYRAKKLSKINRLTEKRTELENLLTEKQQELELQKSNSDNISEKQYEEIEQLKKQIENYQKRVSDNLTGKQRLFYDSDIYQHFMSYKSDSFRHQPPTEQEWQSLTTLFRKSFPRYHRFIMEENSLTSDQFKVCVLARLFMPVYAMARILDVDGDRITRIKSQVNKKLFKDETAKTLENHLKNHFDEQV
ncbi:MAG: hypothetical protein SPL55_06450 [Prevotella sp.]|nr:hypothetical protein [Prevotella sp.]